MAFSDFASIKQQQQQQKNHVLKDGGGALSEKFKNFDVYIYTALQYSNWFHCYKRRPPIIRSSLWLCPTKISSQSPTDYCYCLNWSLPCNDRPSFNKRGLISPKSLANNDSLGLKSHDNSKTNPRLLLQVEESLFVAIFLTDRFSFSLMAREVFATLTHSPRDDDGQAFRPPNASFLAIQALGLWCVDSLINGHGKIIANIWWCQSENRMLKGKNNQNTGISNARMQF